jgi:threonine aldolase
MVDRLAEDHRNARFIAEAFSRLPDIQLDLEGVQTNIVIFRLVAPPERASFLAACRARGVLLTDMGNGDLRAVTHADVSAEDCRHAVSVVREVLAGVAPAPSAVRRQPANA